METVLMKALRATYYAGRTRNPGEVFAVALPLVKIMTATKAASLVEEPQPSKKNTYKRKDLRAE